MRRLLFSFLVLTLVNLIIPNFYINGVLGAELVAAQEPPVPCDPESKPCGFLQKINANADELSDVQTLVKGNETPDTNVVAPPLVTVHKRENPFNFLFNRNLNTPQVKDSPGIELSRNIFGDFFSSLGLGSSAEVNTTASTPNKEPSGKIPDVPPVPTPPKLDVVPPAELPAPPPPPPAEKPEEKPADKEPAKKVKRADNVVVNEDRNATLLPAPALPIDGILELFIFTIVPSINSTNPNVTTTADATPLLS